jgi:PTS system galactitol-specific IIB component
MKKMLIMCGAGHATSTVVRSKVESWLNDKGLMEKVSIKQSAVSAELENIADNKYDIVISTTIVPDDIKPKVINGVALLTGIGADKVFQEVATEINK